MKRFMYLSIGLMCMAITLLIGFHLGSHSVQAQAPEAINGYRVYQAGTLINHFIMLSNGDVYRQTHEQGATTPFSGAPAFFVGNFWGGTVPVSEHLGQREG